MGKSAPKMPAPPDPKVTAQAQTQSNIETALANAQLNRINEVGPYGSVMYETGPAGANGLPSSITRTTTLSPEQQAIMDAQNKISIDTSNLASDQIGRVRETLGTGISLTDLPSRVTKINTSGLQELPGINDFGAERQKVEDALYERATQFMGERFGESEETLRQRLLNQGIAEDSDAFSRAMRDFGRSKNEAYSTAANDAILAGGAEQSRLFADAMAGRGQGFQEAAYNANLQNAAREAGLQEKTFLRNLPLTDIAALMGTSNPAQLPQFTPTPQIGIAPTDTMGATYNSYNAAANNALAQQQAKSNFWGNIFGTAGQLGAGAIIASDRRLKTKVREVGEHNGLKVYEWEYKSAPGKTVVGLMADEVKKLIPDAVKRFGFYDVIDYGEIA